MPKQPPAPPHTPSPAGAPKPRLSTRPWAGYTARERKRPAVLAHCPSAACRRAKACVDAHDGLYCQRSHCSVAEAAALARTASHGRADAAAPSAFKPLPARASLAEVKAHRAQLDFLAEDAARREAALAARWQAGELDHLYGPWRKGGVWLLPPPKVFR